MRDSKHDGQRAACGERRPPYKYRVERGTQRLGVRSLIRPTGGGELRGGRRDLRQAHVRHFRPACAIYHDVLGLDVPMDDAVAMCLG